MNSLIKYLNQAVVVLAIAAFLSMIATSGEQVPEILKNGIWEPILLSLGYPNTILFNLSSGFLMSAFFWCLVVYLPDKKRRSILRNKLNHEYEEFKFRILYEMLWAADQYESVDFVRKLGKPEEFIKYFSENKKEQWYAVINGLQTNDLRLKNIEAFLLRFAYSIEYTLNNVVVLDEDDHSLLSHLNQVLIGRHRAEDRHDRTKDICALLWSIFARFDVENGYYTEDLIAKTIGKL